MRFVLGILTLCAVYTMACGEGEDTMPEPGPCEVLNVSYLKHIRPIIDSNCMSSGCHVNGASMGDFSTYAVIKSKVDNGQFRKRVVELKVMPPTSKGPLTEDELTRIRCWLDKGAPEN